MSRRPPKNPLEVLTPSKSTRVHKKVIAARITSIALDGLNLPPQRQLQPTVVVRFNYQWLHSRNPLCQKPYVQSQLEPNSSVPFSSAH